LAAPNAFFGRDGMRDPTPQRPSPWRDS